MKKVLAIATIGMFVLTACKKDYTCECTAPGETTETWPMKNVKKKDAKKACDALSALAAISSGSCSLK